MAKTKVENSVCGLKAARTLRAADGNVGCFHTETHSGTLLHLLPHPVLALGPSKREYARKHRKKKRSIQDALQTRDDPKV